MTPFLFCKSPPCAQRWARLPVSAADRNQKISVSIMNAVSERTVDPDGVPVASSRRAACE